MAVVMFISDCEMFLSHMLGCGGCVFSPYICVRFPGCLLVELKTWVRLKLGLPNNGSRGVRHTLYYCLFA